MLRDARVLDTDGTSTTILAGLDGRRALVVLSPQLGDFDSAEYAEHLAAVADDLSAAGIALRFVGIGEPSAARKFAGFNGLPLDCVRATPDDLDRHDRRGHRH